MPGGGRVLGIESLTEPDRKKTSTMMSDTVNTCLVMTLHVCPKERATCFVLATVCIPRDYICCMNLPIYSHASCSACTWRWPSATASANCATARGTTGSSRLTGNQFHCSGLRPMMHLHAVARRHSQPLKVWLASVRTNLHPPAATDSAPATTQTQGDQFDSPTKHLLLHMLPAHKDRCPDCAGQACLSASSSKAKGGSTGMR